MLYLSILLVCLSLIIFVLLYQRQVAIRQALEPKDEQLKRLDLESQRLRGELAQRESQLEQLRQEHSQRLQQLARLEEQTQQQEALKAELASLQQDYLQSQTSLSAQSQELRQLREQLAASRAEQGEISQTLRESFRNLATEVLQGQRAELSTRNLEQLAPLREELQRFTSTSGRRPPLLSSVVMRRPSASRRVCWTKYSSSRRRPLCSRIRSRIISPQSPCTLLSPLSACVSCVVSWLSAWLRSTSCMISRWREKRSRASSL